MKDEFASSHLHLSASRLYRTGDLVRYRPNGQIEFLGRMDHQVKVRGFRIELGEIETLLEQHPAITHSVVIVREDTPGDQRLVAYNVGEETAVSSPTELHNSLQQNLPHYMIPNRFIWLDTLPLTPNGKVNRRALPAPDAVRPELEIIYVAPRNPIEEMVVDVWANILGVEQIGVHDNFFELGGHSLLATQVISRMRQLFQVELPLRTLFKMSTVAGMAAYIEEARQEDSGRRIAPIVPVEHDILIPDGLSDEAIYAVLSDMLQEN
jgi:acyl carrier protein